MDLINNKQYRERIIHKLFSNDCKQDNKENNTNIKEITYRDNKFRIGKIGDKYIMAIYLEGIGYVGFKNCTSMSECWNTLNNFNINDLVK